MKIKAVRLREVGCFSDPIAVEGFSGGLDVLAGRNEFGKSTILKAVQALFAHKHTARNSDVEKLRSYAGGAPLIEVDFESRSGTWRLRKQFLSEPQSLLTDLGTGKVAARGENAHEQALQLCAGNAGGLFNLLWIGQTKALDVPAPEKEGRQTLETALEQDIATLAGGAQARAVRAKAASALGVLLTARTQKARGPYSAALEDRNKLSADLEEAKRAAQNAAGRLDRLANLRDRRAHLLDPATVQSRQGAMATLQRQVEEAIATRRKLEAAEVELRTARSRASEAGQAYEFLRRDALELSGLHATEEGSSAARSDAAEHLQKLEGLLGGARSERDALRISLVAARRTMEARERADKSEAASRAVAELDARLAEWQAVSARISELEMWLRTEPVTHERCIAADREARAIAILEASLAAACPKVRVSYVASPAGRLRVGGRTLADGEVLSPTEPLVIEIAGIGAIEIDPGGTEDIAESRANLDAHRSELAEVLQRMGVTTVAEAREAYERRQATENELRHHRAQLDVLAPQGFPTLQAKRDAWAKLVRPAGTDGVAARADIERDIERLVRDEALVESRVEELTEAHANAREALARLSAESHSRLSRIAELESTLPPIAVRAARLEEAKSQSLLATEGLNNAIRGHTVWLDEAMGIDALDALQANLTKLRQEEERNRSILIELDRDLAVLDAQLELDRQDDLVLRRDELEGGLALANIRVGQYERETAALQMLVDQLDEMERRSRDGFVRPIISRLEPLLNVVLPDARVEIGKDLRVDRVVRRDQSEVVQALSQGTREQISVLVRLAFGRLLADTGQPAPLILDDALVYSDDTRIEMLFDVLRNAAAAHQIIVLTCRSRTFETLGGARLTVEPWSGS